MARELHYPVELILSICAFVYSSGLPAPAPSLDPLVLSNENGVPTTLPSSAPPGSWSEPVARLTLANLCLVNRAWHAGAKPWLWRKIEVRLPRSWLGIVEEVVGAVEDESTSEQSLEASIKAVADAALASTAVAFPARKRAVLKLELGERVLEKLNAPDSPIPPELLSPPASRDPSPRRQSGKSRSPDRIKLMQTIRDALQNVIQDDETGVYLPPPQDPRPGRFVRHLDFNHFRTIGMFRMVEEGNNSRFVTGDRIEAILKEMVNLTAFGATEYMDGALTLTVLKELFLRGSPSQTRGRRLNVKRFTEDGDVRRRGECADLEAVDLTGCVSAAFVNALTEFVSTIILPSTNPGSRRELSQDETRRSRVQEEEIFTIPGLKRLGLRGVKSVPPHILMPFVLAFPSLTHLDLSGTRATPELLAGLGQSHTIRLHSLSLARCVMLTGECIKNFLIHSPVARRIEELSLYGDMTYSSPLSEDDVHDILAHAPCFTSGSLVYVDLSSCPLTQEHLVDAAKPQPKLRSLGLSYIPNLRLKAIAEFLLLKAPNVEVLTLINSSPELDCALRPGGMAGSTRVRTREAALALHSQVVEPLCASPFSFRVFPTAPTVPPLTRLRVLELCTPLLAGLGAGASSWRVVRSKGGRGWYVDTASGWVADGKEGSMLRRDLDKSHVLRKELDRLADANGNVSSGIGWHARKMEILHGHGMLGREDGLYGAVSFAHQG